MDPTVVWPGISRLIFWTQIVLVLVSVARFAVSAYRLHVNWGKGISLENVLKGQVSSDLLSASGLANRLPCKALSGKRAGPKFALEKADTEIVANTVGASETRFRYFWERCHANVDSARQAALLIFLLSLVTAAYTAYPLYYQYFNDNNRTGADAVFLAGQDLLILVGRGWALCAVLYFVSSFFDRALVKRKISWNYFCAALKAELK